VHDDKRAVAQVRSRPAVPAGADRDLHVALACQGDRAYDVVLAGGLDDEVGEAVGNAPVPHAGLARLLVTRIAAAQDSALRFRQRSSPPQQREQVRARDPRSELTVAQSCVQSAVNDFVRPDVDAPLKATDVALNRKRTDNAPPPSQTSVTVLNGNGQAGSAATAGSQLASRGYQIVTGGDGNAPSWEYFRSEVYYQGTPKALAAARKLAKLFGDARVQPLPPEISPLSNNALVTVVVGQTYHGTIAPSAADRTPTRSRPNVRRDSSAVSLLVGARKRVPYRLYAPTVIDANSRLDDTTPIRVYKLGDHNAVRLTYTNGVGDFWGVQMTDWEDAPVLGDPNDSTVIKRRTYRLYYNGPHLHMVVLEAGGATYWVTNTVLDKLSNETMLEIAKGLRPLSR